MKTIVTSLKMLGVFSVLTGIVYPALIWGYSTLFIVEQSRGSFIFKQDKIVGSELIGQKFSEPHYFWPRPSVIEYNPLSSGASNLGPTSNELKQKVDERTANLQLSNKGIAPQDLVFASASGLDPHISVESAQFQISRVAISRGIDISTLQQLVQDLTEKPQYGLFGEARVNVLKLNLALDEKHQ